MPRLFCVCTTGTRDASGRVPPLRGLQCFMAVRHRKAHTNVALRARGMIGSGCLGRAVCRPFAAKAAPGLTGYFAAYLVIKALGFDVSTLRVS